VRARAGGTEEPTRRDRWATDAFFAEDFFAVLPFGDENSVDRVEPSSLGIARAQRDEDRVRIPNHDGGMGDDPRVFA